jgi:hypothetical protein
LKLERYGQDYNARDVVEISLPQLAKPDLELPLQKITLHFGDTTILARIPS